MNAVLAYLRIPKVYEGNRSSLSWSPTSEAIDWPDGRTFAFARQVAEFLEGYGSNGRLIHFSYILAMIELLDAKQVEFDEPELTRYSPGRDLSERSDSLARAFAKAKKPWRNAGALCSWLCREIPPVVAPPDWREVCHRLVHGNLASHLATEFVPGSSIYFGSDSLPVALNQFEIQFLIALKRHSPEEIEGWLEYGRRPMPFASERVAETLEAFKPKSLEEILAELEDHERLAGAIPMVSQFVSALTLPPRRLAHQALPTGGYADVATRGRPEQILPSQFAIDDIEFLRRFAENELLYFHREEPHDPLTEELVLLIDQGIRTWGKVRHALSASALALARLSGRKKLRLLLTSTGVDGQLFDPLTTDEETLGTLLESSDLSPNPGEALDQALETPAIGRRDLIILTHPRNVAEPEFVASTRRVNDSTRLFTVAIDDTGAVQFREWRRGVPLKIVDFRVDFNPPSNVLEKPDSSRQGPDPLGWRGDVEPVPFPFRFGVTQRIERPLFDFDDSCQWLLLSTYHGLLHAWKIDGSAAEILPRGMLSDHDSILDQVETVIGVADGFVVCGFVGRTLVVMHYDMESRYARAYKIGPTTEGKGYWHYSRELHTLVLSRTNNNSWAIDLSNHELHEVLDPDEILVGVGLSKTRANPAVRESFHHFHPVSGLHVVEEGTFEPERGGFVRLDRATGEVKVERVVPPWAPFLPTADGRPMLKNCFIDYAQWRGNVLALLVKNRDNRSILHLFQSLEPGDGGQPLVTSKELTPSSDDPSSLILSQDGRMIARRLSDRQIEIREIAGAGQVIFTTTKGKTHNAPKVTLGRYGMQIHVGKYISLIRWDQAELTVSTVNEGSTRSEIDIVTWPLNRLASRLTPLPKVVQYDPSRFVACARAELTAVVDVFGQVSLFDRSDRLIAMFVAFRKQVAAWMPNGTRFGPSQQNSPVYAGPPTPNAAAIIGRTLKEASEASTSSERQPQGQK
jgi:hypothetical protein